MDVADGDGCDGYCGADYDDYDDDDGDLCGGLYCVSLLNFLAPVLVVQHLDSFRPLSIFSAYSSYTDCGESYLWDRYYHLTCTYIVYCVL